MSFPTSDKLHWPGSLRNLSEEAWEEMPISGSQKDAKIKNQGNGTLKSSVSQCYGIAKTMSNQRRQNK